MQRLFFPDTVTIVRKKGDWYEKEEINTSPVLPGASAGRDRIRAGVITRLRKDPSVALLKSVTGSIDFEAYACAIDYQNDFERACRLEEGLEDISSYPEWL